jgi:hypothetical protein
MVTDKPPRQWKSIGVEVQVNWFANGQRKLLTVRLGNLFMILVLAIVMARCDPHHVAKLMESLAQALRSLGAVFNYH